MTTSSPTLEHAIPAIMVVQAICLPCLIGIVLALPLVGVVTLASYLVTFTLLGLTAGIDLRLGASMWLAVGLGAVAVGLLAWSSTTAELPKAVGIPLIGSLVLSTAMLAIVQRRRRHLPPIHCRACGYDLRGALDETCPECGAVDRART